MLNLMTCITIMKMVDYLTSLYPRIEQLSTRYENDLAYFTPDHRDEKSAERVGTRPAVGSRFFDIDRYPHDFKSNINNAGRFMDKDDLNTNYSHFEMWDPHALVLYIYFLQGIYFQNQRLIGII